MTLSEDEDETLAQFLESEVLYESSDSDHTHEHQQTQEEKDERLGSTQSKRLRGTEDEGDTISRVSSLSTSTVPCVTTLSNKSNPWQIESGIFSRIPLELFNHILKFLSSEDLIACSLACRFLNYAASDESLWRRLYCMRWGLLLTKKLRKVAWKRLYIERDEEDMSEFVRNCPLEFKEYYIQMQVAKRSQAPLPSQVNEDRTILDKTVGDQVSLWKSSRGLTDNLVIDHACSGETCSYYQIGDVFVCEKTGNVHVCDDTCREAVLDPTNELLVCTISGHCFDRLLSPAEMEPDPDQQQCGVTDEAEPFMGSGRFARAYSLGYNCADEKELEAALRFC